MGELYELCTYTAAPGRMEDLTRAYAEWRASAAAAGRSLTGAWTCEFGDLNRLLTLCALASPGSPPANLEAAGQVAYERRLLELVRPLQLEGPAAVVEFRTYSVRSGQRRAYLDLMLPALPIRERYSRNIGVWAPLSGDLDQVVHLWGYADLGARMQARNAAFADPDWGRYIATVYPLLARMNSQVLVPTAFSPLR